MTNYQNWNRRYWGSYHVSQRQQLSSLFAGIDKDIQKLFFSLDQKSVSTLLRKYGALYGDPAEKYARKTYAKWKSGETKLSGQTAQRLLNLIPPFLPADARYDLVKKLRKHHLRTKPITIMTSRSNWRDDVIPAFERLLKVSDQFVIPDSLISKAAWLADGDIDNANRMLAAIELDEAKIRAHYLAREFQQIESLVANCNHRQAIQHVIELPQGTITVCIQEEKQSFIERLLGGEKMNDERKQLSKKIDGDLDVRNKDRQNMLSRSLDELSDEDRKRILTKAFEARVELDKSEEEADHRYRTSSKDMQTHLDYISTLDKSTNSDYDVNTSFRTASGKTDVRVKKNNNTVVIIVAIVIGVIILAIMTK